jgi:antitoxin component HigA of HigAB toxin-antitoxin module
MSTETQRLLIAKPQLRDAVEVQGRRYDWLADKAGVTKFHLSHVLAGRRRLNQDQADRVSQALGIPLFLLFELPDGSDLLPNNSEAA